MDPLVATWASWAGLCVGFVGAAVLSGWIFGLEALKTVYGPITMKTNAAVAFVSSGAALWLVTRRYHGIAAACAAVTVALGAATLSEHIWGWNLGIDELLFTEEPGAAGTA